MTDPFEKDPRITMEHDHDVSGKTPSRKNWRTALVVATEVSTVGAFLVAIIAWLWPR
jgi:hypothetical protein